MDDETYLDLQMALAPWLDQIQARLYPPEIVIVLPLGVAAELSEFMCCPVVHAEVDRPMVAIPCGPAGRLALACGATTW